MATNPNVNFQTASNEQSLIEDIVVEAHKFHGIDVNYLPRANVNVDDILNEPEYYTFNSSRDVEVYLKSYDSFEGDGQFLSPFGLEIRDQLVFSITNRSFDEFVGTPESMNTPREGDLIYVPMLGAAYQIMYAKKDSIFYQLGQITSWDLTCELFEYSNEVFSTGVSGIDDKYNALSTDGEADIEAIDLIADNEIIETEGSSIIDFTEKDPFSESTY